MKWFNLKVKIIGAMVFVASMIFSYMRFGTMNSGFFISLASVNFFVLCILFFPKWGNFLLDKIDTDSYSKKPKFTVLFFYLLNMLLAYYFFRSVQVFALLSVIVVFIWCLFASLKIIDSKYWDEESALGGATLFVWWLELSGYIKEDINRKSIILYGWVSLLLPLLFLLFLIFTNKDMSYVWYLLNKYAENR